MKKKTLVCDLCVIGGGIAGLCVAVSSARKGVKVVLVHDRNVLGGNASSEIRMWPRGASTHFPEYREGGLIEEIALDNMHYNPEMNYSRFDAVLYNKAVSEKNINLLLGTTCIGADCDKNKISSITAWQLASYITYEIKADYYADCSGDCILAEFTDAQFMKGRESKAQYNEPHAKEVADDKTMGNSCLFQLRKTEKQVTNQPFPFEIELDQPTINRRINFNNSDYLHQNFWWMELGGNKDALKDADEINKELISLSFSTYSEMVKKTEGKNGWTLDWVGFLAGKRETRRYVGDYVLNENDLLESKPFDDEIAYGAWSLDDHNPDGFYGTEPNIKALLKNPYAIPYRCVYSKNIDNLFFAGRNISVTHLALSSTRVIATCSIIGQAVGNACVIAKKYGVSPREVGQKFIKELQQEILNDDCYLLNTKRKNCIDLGNSLDRNINGQQNVKIIEKGEKLKCEFDKTYCNKLRFVFDSDFTRSDFSDSKLKLFPLQCYNALGEVRAETPSSLVKDFVIEIKVDGKWQKIEINNNFQRLFFIPIKKEIEGVCFYGTATHGSEKINIFSIDVIN